MKKILLSGIISVFFINVSSSQIITTVIGDGVQGALGNGGPATSAEIDDPVRVIIDKKGNKYISQPNYNDIRIVSDTGIISKYLGGFNYPSDIGIDAAGNIYVMNAAVYQVLKITPAKVVSVYAGNGIAGCTGDSSQATAASIDCGGICVDDSGNVYVSESGQNNVRKINKNGIITTIAGNGKSGFSGDGGPATNAEFNTPTDVFVAHDGSVYIADEGNNRVRRIDKAGIINTIAGTGVMGYSGDGGRADSAQMYYPCGTAEDSKGNIYITDMGNNCIREISKSGIITTVVGNGSVGYYGDGGLADSANLNEPVAVTFDSVDNMYIADYDNYVVRMVSNNITQGFYQPIAGYGVKVLPNPSEGYFSFQISDKVNQHELKLYNDIGVEVKSEVVEGHSFSIDISEQPSGVYLYKIADTETKNIVSGKIIKQ